MVKKRGKEKRRKYIKKQQIRNQNLKTVPISMENKKKRTTHPEIWILENRNRGFCFHLSQYAFFSFFFFFFFPSSSCTLPFYRYTPYGNRALCPSLLTNSASVRATMAQHEIGNWALGTPSSASQTCAISLWGWNFRGSR